MKSARYFGILPLLKAFKLYQQIKRGTKVSLMNGFTLKKLMSLSFSKTLQISGKYRTVFII